MRSVWGLSLVFLALPGAVAGDSGGANSALPPGVEDVLIHFERGVIDHTFTWEMSKDSYEVRMEFLSQKGIDEYGTLTLTYDPENENISGIKGEVILPDGSKVKITKKDIHQKKVSGEWGDKEIEINVAFPALQVGAIVEYAYQKSYEGMDKTSYWAFQGPHYTKVSEIKFIPWPYRKWGYNITNLLENPEFKKTKNKMQMAVTLTRKNIPPLKKEKYYLPYDCLREGVNFYYFDADFVYDNFWPECGEYLYKIYYKKYMKPCGPAKKIVAEHFADGGEDLVERIYAYVTDHYFPFGVLSKAEKEAIDEKYIKKLSKANAVSDLFDFPYLTKSQINFVLASLLATARPDAQIDLAFYVAWDENVFNPQMKTYAQFKDRMLKVTDQGRVYWLAPAKRFLAANTLPWNAKGTEIVLIGENGCSTEQIPLDTYDENRTRIEVEVTLGDDETVVVDRTRTLNPNQSYVMRKSLLFFEENEVRDLLEDAIQKTFGAEAKLSDVEVEQLTQLDQPLVIREKFSYPHPLEEVGDKILFRFPALDRHKDNPFQAAERTNNIFFPYAYQTIQTATYHLPEEYTLVSLPGNEQINEKLFTYKVEFQKIDDRNFCAKSDEKLETNILTAQASEFQKNTYNNILTLDRKAAVLTEE